MNSIALLDDQLSIDTYVSAESSEFGQPMWQLLRVGLNQGSSTSITEAAIMAPENASAEQFQHLKETINRECAYLSSAREVAQHPAYLQVIEMGPRALPLILKELEERPGHWFLALREITQENPILPEHRGVITEMTQDWLNWARGRGTGKGGDFH